MSASQCPVCSTLQKSFAYRIGTYEWYRCLDCGSVYLDPMPTDTERATIYAANTYYSRGIGRAGGPEVTRRLKLLGHLLGGTGTLLDVGCAAGFFMAEARQRGWIPTGVEISAHTAQYAREHFGLVVHEGELLTLDLPVNSFDVVSLWEVIEHLPTPQFMLRRAAELLKPGGILCLSTPNIGGWMGRLMRDKFVYLTPPEHVWLSTASSAVRLLTQSGLEVVRVNSNDLITPEKALRGAGKVLRRNLWPTDSASVWFLARAATRLTQPFLDLLGALRLGSQLEVYARRPRPSSTSRYFS